MELVKVFDEMYNPITMYKSDVQRQASLAEAKKKTDAKNKAKRGFIPNVHKLEPLL